MDGSSGSAAKVAVRDRLLTTRRRRGLLEMQADARAVTEHLLAWEPLRRAATVTAYVSIPGEPGTGQLLETLVARGRHVLLPVVRPDGELDWARHDGPLVAAGFDERDPAVKELLSRAIAACKARGKYIGICGQGPSDHPDLAEWLLEQGIDTMSLNPDTVVETWTRLGRRG